jgi:LAO/AO transport system kinase
LDIRKNRLSVEAYLQGVISGDRVVLSRAVTLIESNHPEDQILAHELMESIMPYTGNSIRLGITGVPGVGKSTFIESFGTLICNEKGKKLAVLTIDPSSQRTKGSILGDKTRMEELARNPKAYIRPSATGSSLGGVAAKTRETMLLCEAAGYDFILVETVGVGQSETTVKGMVDFFLLLMLAGAGDELQGIKKGIMEMADAIAISKADGDNKVLAIKAKADYQNALHLFPVSPSGWLPKVFTCSAFERDSWLPIWDNIMEYAAKTKANGYFDYNRKEQNKEWFHQHLDFLLKMNFLQSNLAKERMKSVENQVMLGVMAPTFAAREMMKSYLEEEKTNKHF